MNEKNPKNKPPYTYLSLFCGCGGFDLGFTQANYKCVGAFDIDPIAVKTHQNNFGNGAIIKDLKENHEIFQKYKNVDVVIAGPPCQGFSTAGKRCLDDPRNHLLEIAGKIALEVKPKVFVVENVRGVISGSHKKYWDHLHKMMKKDECYQTFDFLADSIKYGLAQTRKRMMFIAWNTTKKWEPSYPNIQPKTLRDALNNMEGTNNHIKDFIKENTEDYKIAKHISPGQKLCNVRGGSRAVHTWDIPEVYGQTTEKERKVLNIILHLRRRIRLRDTGDADPVLISDINQEFGADTTKQVETLIKKGYVRKIDNRYDITHAFNGKYRRLEWEMPSYTVDTRFINPKYFLHPDEDRGFTIREAARIQGFPDTFKFCGSEKEQCKVIGNAVPPPLGKWLALNIQQLIE